MELGDKKLIVQLASIGANKPPTVALPPGSYLPPIMPASLLAMSNASNDPTDILMLLNMVTPEELKDDEEYEGKEIIVFSKFYIDFIPYIFLDLQIFWTILGKNAPNLVV